MRITPILSIIILLAFAAHAQTAEFTYQGKLSDNSIPANANYDLQFQLFDAALNGNLLGTQSLNDVVVANGIFTVKLNFGSQFNGVDRFLAISVKPAGGPAYTLLNPRQQITSAPYAIKSLNAQTAFNSLTADLAADSSRLGGISASQFVDGLTDARDPLPGSNNYIRTGLSVQTTSGFNISGTGIAGIFNAGSQFSINGVRVLSVGGSQNVFVGQNAGTANTTGFGNTFAGHFAGNSNTTAQNNSFFGTDSGRSLNAGTGGNSFFGRSSGFATTSGINNSFFGLDSGRFNITGSDNAFFGKESGFNNTADGNSFYGYRSGRGNTSGDSNSFFGNGAGEANQTGSFNSFFGNNAGNLSTGISNSFFGHNAGLSTLGGGSNAFFGTAAGQSNTTGSNNTFYGTAAGFDNAGGSNNTAIGFLANVGSGLNFATAIGSGSSVIASNTIALGRSNGSDSVLIYGNLAVNGTFNLPAGDADYIQNRTTQQSASNFNVSGTGTANIFNAALQFNISGNRVLSTSGTNNLFVGGTGTSTGTGNTFIGSGAGNPGSSGNSNTFIGNGAGSSSTTGSDNVIIGTNSNIGSGASNTIVIGNGVGSILSNAVIIGTGSNSVHIDGDMRVGSVSILSYGSGSTSICRNGAGDISNCSSSLRYKTNVRSFFGGMDLVKRLRPVTFDWKADGVRDVGFIAEEIDEIEPLLVTHNKDGQIEGVKYAQITTILVNAMKEQQKQIEQQQRMIDSLRKLACSQDNTADLCRSPEERP